MQTLQHILVYVGTDTRGELAVERAACLAEAHRAAVTLAMHVTSARSEASLALERLAAVLTDRGVDVRLRILSGGRLGALLEEIAAQRVDLVVKAADRHGLVPSVWPSFTEQLMRQAKVPVWVVRLAPAPRPSTIVAVLSDASNDDPVHDACVLAASKRLAKSMSASLFVLSDGALISESGQAARLPVDGLGHLDLVASAVDTLRADLVVVGRPATQPRFRRDVVAGVLRHTHASLIMVPRGADLSRRPAPERKAGLALRSLGTVALSLGALGVLGCAPPPRGLPIATAAKANTAANATAKSKPESSQQTAYDVRTTCKHAETTSYLGPIDRGPCCPSTVGAFVPREPSHVGSTTWRFGYDRTACGPEPIQVDFARDPSLSPSERVRPGGQIYELGW